MKINFWSVKQITTTLCMATLLVSCDGSNKEVPPPPPPVPVGKVTGVVMLGPVDNATLSLYKLDPVTGEEMEPAMELMPNATGRSGKFNFTLQLEAAETPFALCATEGIYNEPAALPDSTRAAKDFGQGERLCAAFVYKKADAAAKKDTIVNITFFTHLAYGITKFEMDPQTANADGTRVLFDKKIPADTTAGTAESIEYGAIGKGLDDVRQWFNFTNPILEIEPKLVNDSRNTQSASRPTEGLRYGLALTGISSTADWLVVNASNEATKATDAAGIAEGSFKNVSSISFAQLAFEDMAADGQLNGVGKGAPLKLNGTTTDGHVYLHHTTTRMLAVVGSKINQSGVTDGFGPFIEQMSSHRDTVFDRLASIPKRPPGVPTILHQAGFDATAIVKGKKTVKVNVLDASGIKSVTLSIVKKNATTPLAGYNKIAPTKAPDAIDPSIKEWLIDTNNPAKPDAFPDGSYTLIIEAFNNNGLSELKEYNFKVGNKGLTVAITSPTTAGTFINGSKKNFAANVTNPFQDTATVIFDIVGSKVTDIEPQPAVKVLQAMSKPILGTAGTPGSNSYSVMHVISTATPPLKDDEYQFRVRATTGAGALAVNALDLTTFILDTTNPTGTITSPVLGANEWKKTSSFTVFADVNDVTPPGAVAPKISGIKSVIATVGTNTKPFTLTYTNGKASGLVTVAQEGQHDITLKVVDKALNTFQQLVPVSIVYDKTPPTIKITSNTANPQKWVRTLDVTGLASDNPGSGIAEVGYTVAGAYTRLTNFKTPVKVDAKISLTSYKGTGEETITLVAKDLSGQTIESPPIKVGFDAVPPTLRAEIVLPPQPGASVSSTTSWTLPSNVFKVIVASTEAGAQSGISTIDDGTHPNHKVGDAGFIDLASATLPQHPHSISPVTVSNAKYEVVAERLKTYDVSATCSAGTYSATAPATVTGTIGTAAGFGGTPVEKPGTYTIKLNRLAPGKTGGGCFGSLITDTVAVPGLTIGVKSYTESAFTYTWTNPVTTGFNITQSGVVPVTADKLYTKQIDISALDIAGNKAVRVICLNASITNSGNKTWTSSNYPSVITKAASPAQFTALDNSVPRVTGPSGKPKNCTLSAPGVPPLASSCSLTGSPSGAINVTTTSGLINSYSVVYSSSATTKPNEGVFAEGTRCPNI